MDDMGISKIAVTCSFSPFYTPSGRPEGLRRQQKRLLIVTVIQSKVLVTPTQQSLMDTNSHKHNLCICEVCNV